MGYSHSGKKVAGVGGRVAATPDPIFFQFIIFGLKPDVAFEEIEISNFIVNQPTTFALML